MKNIIVFFLISLLFSCNSSNKIIQNYLIEDAKNDSIKVNVLVKQKIIFNETFRIFQGMKVIPKTKEELEINEELKKAYSNEIDENWAENDFKRVSFDIINRDSIDSYISKRRQEFKNKIEADRFNLFFISKLYYYNNYKNAFFNISKFQIFRNIIYNEVIILEKQKGKWVIVEKRENRDLY